MLWGFLRPLLASSGSSASFGGRFNFGWRLVFHLLGGFSRIFSMDPAGSCEAFELFRDSFRILCHSYARYDFR